MWGQEVSQTARLQPPLQAQQPPTRAAGSLPAGPAGKPGLHPLPQRHDGPADAPSSHVYPRPGPTTAPVLLQQVQPVFATQNLGSQTSLPGLLVPVRIQTHVPTFGSVMYTSVSQLGATQGSWPQGPRPGAADKAGLPVPAEASGPAGRTGSGFNLLHFLGQPEAAAACQHRWRGPDSPPEQQLKTGIPLSLTSGTVSTTDASGSGVGAGKRVLSPASSLERFIQTKQQKRVKEERMYGQIVKELSAVELSGADGGGGPEPQGRLQTGAPGDACERMSSSPPPPLGFLPAATKIAVPVRSSAPHLPDLPRPESFTPPLQIVTERSPVGPEEPPAEGSEAEPGSGPRSMMSPAEDEADGAGRDVPGRAPVSVLVQSSGLSRLGRPLLLTEVADVQHLLQFPSLRTTSRVSWCFLNYTKPSSGHAAVHGSVYSCWSVSSYNPNPLKLSTKATLALLRSKQRSGSAPIYTPAAVSPPSCGKLVSSVGWKLRFEQVGPAEAALPAAGPLTAGCPSVPQLQPELLALDAAPFGRKMKGVASWERSKEEAEEREMALKQPGAEPTRIKIFEGGWVELTAVSLAKLRSVSARVCV